MGDLDRAPAAARLGRLGFRRRCLSLERCTSTADTDAGGA